MNKVDNKVDNNEINKCILDLIVFLVNDRDLNKFSFKKLNKHISFTIEFNNDLQIYERVENKDRDEDAKIIDSIISSGNGDKI